MRKELGVIGWRACWKLRGTGDVDYARQAAFLAVGGFAKVTARKLGKMAHVLLNSVIQKSRRLPCDTAVPHLAANVAVYRSNHLPRGMRAGQSSDITGQRRRRHAEGPFLLFFGCLF